jgi:hypothetical protein
MSDKKGGKNEYAAEARAKEAGTDAKHTPQPASGDETLVQEDSVEDQDLQG